MAERVGGLAGWLIGRWSGRKRMPPSLALIERIALAPRQSLALVEAEGRRILVATSAEGGPAFYPLGAAPRTRPAPRMQRTGTARPAPNPGPRISW